MKMIRVFRILIFLHLLTFALSVLEALYFSTEYDEVQEIIGYGMLESAWVFGVVIIILVLSTFFVSLFLLYIFHTLGKTIYIWSIVFGTILILLSGPHVSSPFYITLSMYSGILTGAVLTFIYFTPLKDHFRSGVRFG